MYCSPIGVRSISATIAPYPKYLIAIKIPVATTSMPASLVKSRCSTRSIRAMTSVRS
jgi:hypothetical protein